MAQASFPADAEKIVFVSPYNKPYINLALEDDILNNYPFTNVCMLYINSQAVVWGKNQVPWRECRPELLSCKGILPVRRFSGGGAVYHDTGNINFSFIGDEAHVGNYLGLVIKTLRDMGVDAVQGEDSDILVNGYKISGGAHAYKHKRALHHGTLLVNSNIEKLRFFLKGIQGRFETPAVSSRPNKVACIERPTYSTLQAFVKSISGKWNAEIFSAEGLRSDNAEYHRWLSKKAAYYAKDTWLYRDGPKFNCYVKDPWGKKAVFKVKKGRIIEIETFDNTLVSLFKGCNFGLREMRILCEKNGLKEKYAYWLDSVFGVDG